MSITSHIGIDLGGTNIRAAILQENRLVDMIAQRIDPQSSSEDMIKQVIDFVAPLFNENVASVGIGVPGLVDEKEKMVYDVVNIPAWKKIGLEAILNDHFKVPVFINNDANCFALGEFLFGKGRDCESMAGLTIGTGLGCGLIIGQKLFNGRNGGAGEFGMIPYLAHNIEYYSSGQYFSNVHGLSGELVFERAIAGDETALQLYHEFGIHLGKAISTILLSIDCEMIVIGGSLKNAWNFYKKAVWNEINSFPYQRAAANLRIEVSALENAGIYGAASLHKSH